MRAGVVPAAAVAASIALAACGGGEVSSTAGQGGEDGTTTTEQVVVQVGNGDFNPAGVYEKAAPGVVTILSVFDGGGAGQGSGFVISKDGEIVTNSHVVASGGANNGGGELTPAKQVFVQFADGNQVPAEILGVDDDADIAVVKVDPGDLDELTVLPLSEREEYAVGEPVAAIGSPFGEEQSLSIGIVSAADRSIEGLSEFAIDNAIQTDASINPGNSGGPLLDSDGNVIGVNQQIATSSGTNSGVGYAIPAGAVRFSVDQIREKGEVDYAYLGVTTQSIWPQLADELGLETESGALVSQVVEGGPADDAGLEGSSDQITFQGTPIETGGDVIVAVDGRRLEAESDLAELISRRLPGTVVVIEIIRDGDSQELEVELKTRPDRIPSP
ncbi:MAG: PDZ domain-containing protein [Actinobacteria bacterium]|nr:PDZ domain-containing protein [Actinomycetota bacterium]